MFSGLGKIIINSIMFASYIAIWVFLIKAESSLLVNDKISKNKSRSQQLKKQKKHLNVYFSLIVIQLVIRIAIFIIQCFTYDDLKLMTSVFILLTLSQLQDLFVMIYALFFALR